MLSNKKTFFRCNLQYLIIFLLFFLICQRSYIIERSLVQPQLHPDCRRRHLQVLCRKVEVCRLLEQSVVFIANRIVCQRSKPREDQFCQQHVEPDPREVICFTTETTFDLGCIWKFTSVCQRPIVEKSHQSDFFGSQLQRGGRIETRNIFRSQDIAAAQVRP